MVAIGKVIAVIETAGAASAVKDSPAIVPNLIQEAPQQAGSAVTQPTPQMPPSIQKSESTRFYSPLVRNIAKEEHISMQQLDGIAGSGLEGRLTKRDLMNFIAQNKSVQAPSQASQFIPATPPVAPQAAKSISGNVEIIEMDRMRKLIADHMVMSKQTSPHVTSFVEVDVTNLVQWRDKIKDLFQRNTIRKSLLLQFLSKQLQSQSKTFQ